MTLEDRVAKLESAVEKLGSSLGTLKGTCDDLQIAALSITASADSLSRLMVSLGYKIPKTPWYRRLVWRA